MPVSVSVTTGRGCKGRSQPCGGRQEEDRRVRLREGGDRAGERRRMDLHEPRMVKNEPEVLGARSGSDRTGMVRGQMAERLAGRVLGSGRARLGW